MTTPALTMDDNDIESNEPNGEFKWNFDYENREAAPLVEHTARPISTNRALRGRVGIDDLAKIVSSKRARDIVRRGNFMPGQFEIWNANPKGGNKKYYGAEEDIDGDGVNEFVVRRGNETGPKVAINGYTTQQSDWLVRRDYYKKNPTRKARSAKPLQDWVFTQYSPQYSDDGMTRGDYTHHDEWESHKQYKNYIPKSLSPYQAFGKYIVFPALKQAFLTLAKGNEERAKYVRRVIINASGKKALEAEYLSTIYNQLVKTDINQSLLKNGNLDAFADDFMALRHNKGYKRENLENVESEEYKDFDKWLYSKADIKRAVFQYVSSLIKNHSNELITHLINEIIKLLDIQFLI